MTRPRRFSSETIWCWGILALSFAACLWIFLPLIPADGKALGHDYSSYLPNALAGYYWFFQNGPLAVPWFTPAQCGGLPYFADLTTSYFSVPQWLTIVVSPIAAVRATFVLFAGLGTIGFYLLLRTHFAVGAAAAAAGSVLFLFSGLYAYRFAIGHVALHAHALTPWLAWAVLAPRQEATGRVEAILSKAWPPVAGGAIIAYMFQASMIHMLPCTVLAVAIVLLVHGQRHGHGLRPWVLLCVAGLVGSALSASRLTAITAFLENIPRAYYSLPGFPSAWDLIRVAAAILFWRVSAVDAEQKMANVTWKQSQHEWEYGLGPAALALVVAGAAVAVARLVKEPRRLPRIARSLPALSAIAAALALPLALNWYEPHWNAFLKSLPYFGSSSNLVRWFALYVPVVALLGGLALQRVAPGARSGAAVATLVAIVTIGWNAAADKSYYTRQSYDGSAIEAAWQDVGEWGRVPPITHMVYYGPRIGQLERNNTMTLGYSQMSCYQPIFGYHLENYPLRPLSRGSALDEVAPGVLNVKNPACYLYPRENSCAPGNHFGTDRRRDAARFLGYKPFPFVRSLRQAVADGVTLAALCLAAAVILASGFLALRRALRSRKR